MDLACSVPSRPIERTQTRLRLSASLLIPDLALVASLLSLVYCLLLFDGTRQLFRDSDAGWHIRNGEAILSGAGLPRTDPYSFTLGGKPWFAWEWGSDVIAGAAHLAGGLAFVAGVYALVIAACTWCWFRLHWRTGGNFLIAAGSAALMLTTCNMHWHARPHIFGWLMLLLTLLLAESSARSLIVVALLSVVWTNLHASFFLLPVVLGIYSAASYLQPLVWTSADNRPGKWFLQAALVAGVASLVNPYGPALHVHVLRYLTDKELLDRIGEFQSFNFHSEGTLQVILTLALAGVGSVLALGQRNLARFAVSAMFVVMALRSARALPLVALAVLPLANGSLTRALASSRGLQPRLRSLVDSFLRYGQNLRSFEAGFSGLAWCPVVVAGCFALLSVPAVTAHAGFPPDDFPVRAAGQLAGIPPDSRILSTDKYGGYMIYRFNGALKVWFDGRSDFYGAQYMKAYLSIIEVRPGWQAKLAPLHFDYALLPVRYSLVAALEAEGWKSLYKDQVSTLLRAPGNTKD